MGDVIFEEERSVQHDKAGRLCGLPQPNRRKVANVRGTATSDHHDVRQRLLPYSRSTVRVSQNGWFDHQSPHSTAWVRNDK